MTERTGVTARTGSRPARAGFSIAFSTVLFAFLTLFTLGMLGPAALHLEAQDINMDSSRRRRSFASAFGRFITVATTMPSSRSAEA